MLQPEGQIKDSQAGWHSLLTELLPAKLNHISEKDKLESWSYVPLLFFHLLPISCLSSFSLILFLHVTLVLSVHLSFIYSLYLLVFLCFSLSKNRIINEKGEVPRANTFTHTHDQYKQLHCQQRSSVVQQQRLVHEHMKQTGTYLLSFCGCNDSAHNGASRPNIWQCW